MRARPFAMMFLSIASAAAPQPAAAQAHPYPTVARAWVGAGYELSPQFAARGPVRQSFVTEAAAGIPFIPLEFGLRIGWSFYDDGVRRAEGLLAGVRLGFDPVEFLGRGVDTSRSLSLLNPTVGIGADFAYQPGLRGEVGRGFFYLANTFYLTCNVGIHVSAELSLADWSAAPPTFFIGLVGGQRWTFDDYLVDCNEWQRYRGRMGWH